MPKNTEESSVPAMTARFKRENAVAAAVVLKNPVAYPPGSAMEQWARKVLGEDAK